MQIFTIHPKTEEFKKHLEDNWIAPVGNKDFLLNEASTQFFIGWCLRFNFFQGFDYQIYY